MDKTKLLDKLGADKEDRLLLAKVLDRAEQSHSRNIPASTDFLSPQQPGDGPGAAAPGGDPGNCLCGIGRL